jgi:hypothetical protein
MWDLIITRKRIDTKADVWVSRPANHSHTIKPHYRSGNTYSDLSSNGPI